MPTAEQTIAHQRKQAEAEGFAIDTVVTDEGVPSVSTRLADRPQGKRLFDLLRRGDTLVVRWVDRLGRNDADVTDTVHAFMRRGAIIRMVSNDLTFDGATTDPTEQAVRDALIAFMAASAQAQAEANKEAQRAGVAYAKENGSKRGGRAYRDRKPSFDRQQLATVRDMLGQGAGPATISKATGISRQAIYWIEADPAAAEGMLASWGM